MSHGQLVAPLVDECLGNSAYVVDLGEGRGLAADATRDLRGLHEVARRRGLTVALAADTHLHADFLSVVRDLAAGGARLSCGRRGRSLVVCMRGSRRVIRSPPSPCSGRRPSTDAASLLERAGHRQVSVLVGGPEEWAAATGHALRTGS